MVTKIINAIEKVDKGDDRTLLELLEDYTDEELSMFFSIGGTIIVAPNLTKFQILNSKKQKNPVSCSEAILLFYKISKIASPPDN